MIEISESFELLSEITTNNLDSVNRCYRRKSTERNELMKNWFAFSSTKLQIFLFLKIQLKFIFPLWKLNILNPEKYDHRQATTKFKLRFTKCNDIRIPAQSIILNVSEATICIINRMIINNIWYKIRRQCSR